MSVSGGLKHKQNFENCSIEEEDWKLEPEFKIEEILSNLDSSMRFEDESSTILIKRLGVPWCFVPTDFCLQSRNLNWTIY